MLNYKGHACGLINDIIVGMKTSHLISNYLNSVFNGVELLPSLPFDVDELQ